MKSNSIQNIKRLESKAYITDVAPNRFLMSLPRLLGLLGITLLCMLFAGGCMEPEAKEPQKPQERLPEFIDDNIGNYAILSIQQQAPIRGFGIVAGLFGTGSSECPAELREPLTKQIIQNLPEKGIINVNDFLASKDTAVVVVYGFLPEMPLPEESMDLKVAAHPATQTTSLEGGRLYTTELTEFGRLSRDLFQYDPLYTRSLAEASGPIYIPLGQSNPDLTRGHILGGGKVIQQFVNRLILKQPSYLAAAAIRDRINERFGEKTANALSYQEIRLTVPPVYYTRKDRFTDLLLSLHIRPSEQARDLRITRLVKQMQDGKSLYEAEIALSSIGKPAVAQIEPLLKHPSDEVRFHAARCMADIGSSLGLNVFRQIIKDTSSPLRQEAVEAAGQYLPRDQAIPILTEALSANDFTVRYPAYMQLKRLGDVSVQSTLVADEFLIDSVVCAGPRTLFISQQKSPKIVIFGGPLYCSNDIFATSTDGTVTLNSVPGQGYISIMRKHPKRPKILGPLRSGYKLTDIIKTLCESPEISSKQSVRIRPGLGISYSEMVPILIRLVRSGSIDAELEIEPMTKAGNLLENLTPNDR